MSCRLEIKVVHDDGGRAAAGFRSLVLDKDGPNDCTCRSVAIATGRPYAEVHAALGELAGDPDAAEHANGMQEPYLRSIGWDYTLNTQHLRMVDLPPGRYIIEFRREDGGGHLSALIGDELHDFLARPTLPSMNMWGWWTPNPMLRPPADPWANALTLDGYLDMSTAFVPEQ